MHPETVAALKAAYVALLQEPAEIRMANRTLAQDLCEAIADGAGMSVSFTKSACETFALIK